MKRWEKWLAIGAGIVAALLLTLLLLVKVLLTPERVRATLLPLAQQSLGREVRLGAIEIGLFSGVTVRDFAVLELDRQTVFVGAAELRLRYRFWPLLRGQIAIKEIALQSPRLRIVRQADGRFNFSDLSERPQPAAPPQAAAAEGRSVDLRIARFALHDGTVEFVDAAVATPPFRTEITRLELTARELSLQQAFPFELSLQLAGAPLNVSGTADAAKKRGQLKLRLQGLDLTAFAPYYQAQLPGQLKSGRLDLDLNLDGGTDLLATRGALAVKGLDLTLDGLKEAPLRAEVALDYDLRADLQAKQLTFAESRLTYNGLAVTLAGTVRDYGTAPQLDLTLGLPGLQLQQLAAALPASLGASLPALQPTGTVRARLHLLGPTGEPLKLLRDGEIAFEQVAVSASGLRPVVNGRLLLTGDALKSEGLGLQLGNDRLQLQLASPHLFAQPPALSVAVSGERFDLTPPPATGAQAAAAVPAPAPAEVGPFDLPLRVTASVNIKQLRYSGLTLDDFDLRLRLADNLLTVEPLTARLAGGTLRVEKRVDLVKRGLAYAVQCRVRQAQVEALVDALYPTARGTAYGALDLDLDLIGSGTLPATLKRNLDGTGTFALTDGKLTGAGLAGGLAAYFGEDELRVLRFKRFAGTLRIRQGQLELAASLAGDDLRLVPQGTIGLDGALDLGLDSRFSPKLTQKLAGKGDLGRLVADSEGWGRVPLRVKGTLSEPKIKLDSAALTNQAAEAVRQKLERSLEKRLQKEGADPGKVRLEDALKGLLRR